MKWVTEIQLDNYRAFGKPETIKIPHGQHLLIYGENGSGKSSIYNALKDFFASSASAEIKFKLNKFKQLAGVDTGRVLITVSDSSVTPLNYQFAEPPIASNNKVGEIILANKYKGFLDYKKLLKAHSLEIPDGEQPNLFDLIIKELLGNHRVPDPKGGATTVEIQEEYSRISRILVTNRSNSVKFKQAKKELDVLEKSVLDVLKQVFINANQYLELRFKNKIKLDLVLTKMRVIKPSPYAKKKMVEDLYLKLSYANEEIASYQVFLNEARLSALAVCLYFASIKTFNPAHDALKVLYLDDVFIGLDTSNRFPLLEIIKSEFIDHGFQVFMSTYDREWFELSRHWFNTKVPGKMQALEMFIEDDGNPKTPDYPIVLPYSGNLDKAKAHFKNRDYPAAGNYLRKECELLIRNLLPDTYKVDSAGSAVDTLEPLMNQLEKFYEDCDLAKPKEITDVIRIYRKALLNPSSHSDTKSPLFKREIEDAFHAIGLLTNVSKIERQQVASKGQLIVYENAASKYRVELVLADNLWKVEYLGVTSHSKPKFRIDKWNWNGKDYAIDKKGTVMEPKKREEFCEDLMSIESVFKKINHSTKIPIPINPYAELKIGIGGTLNDLLN